jgi:uncharacterized protein
MQGGKLDNLIRILRGLESALLAYSGGLDSTFLLKAVKLSGIRVLAVTGVSETTPHRDLEDAKRMARELGVGHRIVNTGEMEREEFVKNPPERCFHCKDVLFETLRTIAEEEGLASVMDGSNLDDTADHRPGLEAARRHGVRSPLVEAEFTKEEIRRTSRELGLPLWGKPASPCLSSRFPYGVEITAGALKRVSRAEDFLRSEGFAELRVRDHGGVARIEVPAAELERVLTIRDRLVAHFRALGYDFVSLDLEGLRSGSLNRVLE